MFLQRSPYQNSPLAIFQLDGSKVILEVHHLFFLREYLSLNKYNK